MPCLGPPIHPDCVPHSGLPDTHEFRCDLRDEDPQRFLDAILRPGVLVLDLPVPESVTGHVKSYFCDCLDPRFDAVTIAGVRHSEFCCACGRPGPNDHVD